MMKIVVLILSLFANQNMLCQGIAWQIKNGLCLSLRDSPLPELDYIKPENKKITYSPGLGIIIDLNKRFHLETGLLYENRGWYGDVYVVNPTNGNIASNTKANFSYQFLTSPFLFGYKIGGKISPFLNTGMNMSLRLAGSTKVEGDKVTSLEIIQPQRNSPFFDISWTIGGGLLVKLRKETIISVESYFYRSTTPIGKYHPVEREIFHKGIRFNLGTVFRI